VPVLPRDEVIRRLRALGQPATLFGEEDGERQARLARVEKSVALVDEARGGQQENVLLMLKRQEKAKAKGGGGGGADKAAAAAAAGAAKAAGDKAAAAAADAAAAGPAKAGGGDAGDGSGAAGGPADAHAAAAAAATPASTEDALLANFKAAAERVAVQRAADALPVEDRMARMLKDWCAEWEADLEARSEEVRWMVVGVVGVVLLQGSSAAPRALLLA
jgi:pre-mRNA-splicing factor 18